MLQPRIDMLGDSTERLTSLSGAILDPALDAGLQALAKEAAERLEMPIALVVLLLRRIQFYRAFVGLPADVELARGTDRCVGLCQAVLRSGGVVAISDTRIGELPQLLVDRYGIRSYLGAPVTVGGRSVGTLCCVGVEPRSFSDKDIAAIQELAARASLRLAELAQPPTAAPQLLVDRAVGDAYTQARTLVQRMSDDVALARVATLELGGGVRLLEQAIAGQPERYSAWMDLPRAHADLQELLAGLESTARQLRASLATLERATLSSSGGQLDEAIQGAMQLATPTAASAGGIRFVGGVPHRLLDVPRPVVVSTLAALLCLVAGAAGGPDGGGGIVVRASDRGVHVAVEIRHAGMAPARIASLVDELDRLAEGSPLVARAGDGDGAIRLDVPVRR
jgi:hypothetical protein